MIIDFILNSPEQKRKTELLHIVRQNAQEWIYNLVLEREARIALEIKHQEQIRHCRAFPNLFKLKNTLIRQLKELKALTQELRLVRESIRQRQFQEKLSYKNV